jgi:hypothetical protein
VARILDIAAVSAELLGEVQAWAASRWSHTPRLETQAPPRTLIS